jgi:hypothetical protein
MQDFPIHPPLIVKDTPRPRPLRSIAEARAYIDEGMRLGRPPPWRELYRRLSRAMPTIGVALPIGDKRKTAPSEAILPKHSRSCAFTKLVSDSEAGESGQCRGCEMCGAGLRT